MKKWQIREIFLGGPGSGHHGHKGIPGHQGGSASSGGGSVWTAVKTDSPDDYDLPFMHVGDPDNDTYLITDKEGFVVAGADVDINERQAYIYYIESVSPGGGTAVLDAVFKDSDLIAADAQTEGGRNFFKRKGFEQVVSNEDSSYNYGTWAKANPSLSPQKQQEMMEDYKRWV